MSFGNFIELVSIAVRFSILFFIIVFYFKNGLLSQHVYWTVAEEIRQVLTSASNNRVQCFGLCLYSYTDSHYAQLVWLIFNQPATIEKQNVFT